MATLEEIEIITSAPDKRKDPRSPLMRARAKALSGQKIKVCPFGCAERQLDHNSNCKHVIGYTRDGVTYEPLVLKKGLRVVQVPLRESGEMELNEDGAMVPIMIPDPPPVPRGCKFARISDTYRVYYPIEKGLPGQEPAEQKKK